MWFFLMSKSKQNWHCLKGQSAFNARGKATILVGNKKNAKSKWESSNDEEAVLKEAWKQKKWPICVFHKRE